MLGFFRLVGNVVGFYFIFIFWWFLIVEDKVSLCSSNWPRAYYIVWVDLKLAEIHLRLSLPSVGTKSEHVPLCWALAFCAETLQHSPDWFNSHYAFQAVLKLPFFLSCSSKCSMYAIGMYLRSEKLNAA